MMFLFIIGSEHCILMSTLYFLPKKALEYSLFDLTVGDFITRSVNNHLEEVSFIHHTFYFSISLLNSSGHLSLPSRCCLSNILHHVFKQIASWDKSASPI